MTDDGGRIVRIHMNDLSVVTVRVSSSSTCAAVCDLVRLRSPSARLSLTASDALGITEEIDLDDSDLLLDHMDALASTAYNVRVWCSTGSLPDQHPARIGASSRHQGYLDRRLRPGAYARRWIVVHESRMHVYKDHRSTKSKDSIDLCAAVVRPCPSTGLEFDVIGPQGACRLRCGTRDDASEWVALIERQCVRRIHVNRGFHRAQALLSRQYQWADARDAFVARMQRLPAVLRHDVASGLLVELASAMGAGDLARLTVDAARALDRFDDAVVDLDAFRSARLSFGGTEHVFADVRAAALAHTQVAGPAGRCASRCGEVGDRSGVRFGCCRAVRVRLPRAQDEPPVPALPPALGSDRRATTTDPVLTSPSPGCG